MAPGFGYKMANALSKHWEVIHPDGSVVVVKNLKQFCRDYNLSNSGMYEVASGLKQSYRGWRVSKRDD